MHLVISALMLMDTEISAYDVNVFLLRIVKIRRSTAVVLLANVTIMRSKSH